MIFQILWNKRGGAEFCEGRVGAPLLLASPRAQKSLVLIFIPASRNEGKLSEEDDQFLRI